MALVFNSVINKKEKLNKTIFFYNFLDVSNEMKQIAKFTPDMSVS